MLSDKKALTPVVATIVLCGVVLIVGTIVWSFTYSISSGLQTEYLEGVEEQIDKISERFTIEHITYNNDTKTVRVWVYNYGNISEYGDMDIEVDVYVCKNGVALVDENNKTFVRAAVDSGELSKTPITVTLKEFLGPNSELTVKVVSMRGEGENVVYRTYVVQAT